MAKARARATTAKPLNVRQLLFVSEYLTDLNGAAAYQRTYGTKSLDVAGAARLLADVRVKALVAEGTPLNSPATPWPLTGSSRSTGASPSPTSALSSTPMGT